LRSWKRQAFVGERHGKQQKNKKFQDLDVYQNAYKSMLIVHNQIIPYLPKTEDYDLKDQLRRSTKAVPRLIAEGHSKRHQKRGFQKYIDDALTESNETIVSLNQVRDLYPSSIDIKLCNELIDKYDKISRQLYNLALAWDKFTIRGRKTINDSSSATGQQITNES